MVFLTAIIPNAIMVLLYRKTEEFQYFFSLAAATWRKIIRHA
jgi:hypothetical protein